MPSTTSDLCRTMDDSLQQIRQQAHHARQANRRDSKRIQDLTQQRTQAFVDLARHYLPQLTHQTMSDAWKEVQREIGDVLLRKRDQRRGLRAKIADAHALREELESQRDEVKEKLDDAALVLSCKTGNVKKLLRDAPMTQRWLDEIASLDEEIECYLAEHERIEADANHKLPAYERSSLFAYLKEQQFGTLEYSATGMERRWDRWVARLIGYSKAKKSYDLLVSTPPYLQQLINRKQSRYRSLLQQLSESRKQASVRHGIGKQQRAWEQLSKQVSTIEEQIEEAKWESIVLLQRIDELEATDGEYYREALAIYQRFLEQLDPDAMRVYAECTESTVDDEICARLRKVHAEIQKEQIASKDRFVGIIELEKEAALLGELSTRLREFERETPYPLAFNEDFSASRFVRSVRHKKPSPDEAWQTLCNLLMLPNESATNKNDQLPQQMTPVDASFAAASEFANHAPWSDALKASSLVLLPQPNWDDTGEQSGFSTMAICRSHKEAKRIVKLLKNDSIACFIHSHAIKGPSAAALNAEDRQQEIDIVVSNQDFTAATERVKRYQSSLQEPWKCGGCLLQVAAGRGRCWHCGRRRPSL